MTLNLSENDHHILDEYLNAVLDAYKAGEIDQLEARSDLAHTIAAAAEDEPGMMAYVRAALKRRRSNDEQEA